MPQSRSSLRFIGQIQGFDDLDQEEMYVFCSPACMHFCGVGSDVPDDSFLAQASFAMVFNTALAFHLWGLDTRCDLRMRRAMMLYEHAMTILKRCEIESPGTHSIIANNLGHIHFFLQNHAKAAEYFQKILLKSK